MGLCNTNAISYHQCIHIDRFQQGYKHDHYTIDREYMDDYRIWTFNLWIY